MKALIEQQERDYSWTFSYMGANQDAIEVGMGMGIAAERSLTYGTGAGNVQAAMAAKSAATSALRSAVAAGAAPAAARAAMAYSDDQRAAAAGEPEQQSGDGRSTAPVRSSR